MTSASPCAKAGEADSVKAFISSVVTGFEEFRESADAAIRSLRHTSTRAEDFGAVDSSPQVACLAGVRDADVVVLLLGERYGAPQASGLSATHEEYREARDRKPVLAFVRANVTFQPCQQEFVKEVQDWHDGYLVSYFSNPDELRNELTSALRDLEIAQAVHPFDEGEALQRALNAFPDTGQSHHPALVVSCSSGPHQNILRPSQLGDSLAAELQREAMFGAEGILDRNSATTTDIKDAWLWLRQDNAKIGIDQLGGIVLALPVVNLDRPPGGGLILRLIEEDIQDRIGRGLRFTSWVLDHVDPLARLTHIVVVAGLLNADYLGWMTQAEADTNPSSVTLGFPRQIPPLVQLAPPSRRRQELKMKSSELAEDLTVLLKRERG